MVFDFGVTDKEVRKAPLFTFGFDGLAGSD